MIVRWFSGGTLRKSNRQKHQDSCICIALLPLAAFVAAGHGQGMHALHISRRSGLRTEWWALCSQGLRFTCRAMALSLNCDVGLSSRGRNQGPLSK